MIELPTKAILQSLVQSVLLDHGPMTVAQIAAHVRIPRRNISACISLGRKKYGPALFVIVGYERRVGTPGREAPIYAVPGRNLPVTVAIDAPRPTFDENTHRDRQARYRAKNRQILRMRTNARRAKERGEAPTNAFEHTIAGLIK